MIGALTTLAKGGADNLRSAHLLLGEAVCQKLLDDRLHLVWGLGLRVEGLGFGVGGSGFRVLGSGYGV